MDIIQSIITIGVIAAYFGLLIGIPAAVIAHIRGTRRRRNRMIAAGNARARALLIRVKRHALS